MKIILVFASFLALTVGSGCATLTSLGVVEICAVVASAASATADIAGICSGDGADSGR